jgi:hypothetical protein
MYAEPINATDQYLPRIAGFAKHFMSGDLSLDLVTVKGAGILYICYMNVIFFFRTFCAIRSTR